MEAPAAVPLRCSKTTLDHPAQHLQMLDTRFNRWASASSAAYHSGVRGLMPSRPAALALAEPVVRSSLDSAGCTTRLTLGCCTGSLSALPLPQPSEAASDCTNVSGAGRAAQLASDAQNRETTTK